MVHNIFHCLDILIVTFNVHLNVYLLNPVPPILYGIHVLLAAIGQQLLVRLPMAAAITVHHPMEILAAAIAVVHHLTPTEKRSVPQSNARNVATEAEEVMEVAKITIREDLVSRSHLFQSVCFLALDHSSKVCD